MSPEQQKRHRSRLILVVPAVDVSGAFEEVYASAFTGGDIASVIVALANDDDATWQKACDALMAPAVRAGAAFLLRDRLSLVIDNNADGLHVEAGINDLKKLVKSLSPERIVGVGGVRDRHGAMVAGEMGADYVMFGPANPCAETALDFADVKLLTEWWAELIELPCIAPASSLDEARELIECGTDFVAAKDLVWKHPAGPAAAVAELNALFDEITKK